MIRLSAHFPLNQEIDLYEMWSEKGAFSPNSNCNFVEKSVLNKDFHSFSITMPPPNVTGILHVGHALDTTLQDILVRYHRMKGDNTLWLPGLDHAGIATQMVVERELNKQGIHRSSLSRSEFTKKTVLWKEKSYKSIVNQLKRLGASCDWSAITYTLDPSFQKLVQHAFITLHKEGFIYKAMRLVNWDTTFQTAISDLEVLWKEEEGTLWTITYTLVEASKYEFKSLAIATTRPETLFGDTAIAVSPKDERYSSLIGAFVYVPLTHRKIPIIADDHVDPLVGTGALKVTPAHDFNDYAIGKRHHLPSIQVIDQNGCMNEHAPPLKGLPVLQARTIVIDLLQSKDLITHTQTITHQIPIGDRSGSIIEPLLTEQWFVHVKPLAERVLKQLTNNKPKFTPKNWTAIYKNWLDNIEPWCISRQLWWGHRIPVWYGPDDHVFVASSEQDALVQAHKHYGKPVTLVQEKDVLDTWFSSALWPLGTLKWNEENNNDSLFQKFYPNNVLVTGFDIIFFWVARMSMMGEFFTNNIPFQQVYIHPLIRDKFGQKMSKSKGNTLDPMDLIQHFGCDALRFSLTQATTYSQDIRFSEDHVAHSSKFINKIWNVAKFMDNIIPNISYTENIKTYVPTHKINQAIYIQTQDFLKNITTHLENFRFSDYANTLYSFIWHDFCDQYLEYSKILITYKDSSIVQDTQYTLIQTFITLLKAMHPIMPFISESLWQHFSKRLHLNVMLIQEEWPISLDVSYKDSIQHYTNLSRMITQIRSLKSLLHIPFKENLLFWIQDPLHRFTPIDKLLLCKLCGLEEETNHLTEENKHPKVIHVPYDTQTLLHINIYDVDNVTNSIQHLQKQAKDIQKDIQFYYKKLSNPHFKEKASKHAVSHAQEQYDYYKQQYNDMMKNIHLLQN